MAKIQDLPPELIRIILSNVAIMHQSKYTGVFTVQEYFEAYISRPSTKYNAVTRNAKSLWLDLTFFDIVGVCKYWRNVALDMMVGNRPVGYTDGEWERLVDSKTKQLAKLGLECRMAKADWAKKWEQQPWTPTNDWTVVTRPYLDWRWQHRHWGSTHTNWDLRRSAR